MVPLQQEVPYSFSKTNATRWTGNTVNLILTQQPTRTLAHARRIHPVLSTSLRTFNFQVRWKLVNHIGELCDENRAFYECGFGYRKCIAMRCVGNLIGESCQYSADCNPHQYCEPSNSTCMPAVGSGGTCTSHGQCDMGLVCRYDSNIATSG